MTYQAIIFEHQAVLAAFAHQATVLGLRETWHLCRVRGLRPQEPDLVAGVVLRSMPVMAGFWSTILRRHGVLLSLTSVFCHQTPKVTFDGMVKSSCELGDILFVHVHRRRNGMMSRNALLCQAKISSHQPHRVRANEVDQLALYSTWPDFRYVASGPLLTGVSRAVRPKVPHMGAQYLLMDDRSPNDPASGLCGVWGTYPVGVCMPCEILHDHSDLAGELVRWLMFCSGRTFDDPAQSDEDGWTGLVWDLLRAAVRKGFNRTRSGVHGGPRYVGDRLREIDGLTMSRAVPGAVGAVAAQILGPRDANRLYTSASSADDDAEPPRRQEYNGRNDESGAGVSVVLLETSHSEAWEGREG